jgi:RNA polymerase sigma-70 factor (ECF subfamily)
MYQIKNKCIDYLRKKTALPLDESCISIAPSPEAEVIMRERRNYVRMKLNQLKEDYRTVLYLKEYENFSYAEIAEIMGRNLGQVKILIYRARKSLKAMLESEV